VLTGAVIFGWKYYHSYQKVNVILKGNVKASIYQEDVHEGSALPVKNLAEELSSVRLKKGNYYIKSEATKEYESTIIPIQLADKPISITVNPDFTAQKLDGLLGAEKASIDSVLTQTYPSVHSYYSIQNGKLYRHGEWYATKFIPNNPAILDTLRVILKKDKNTWVVSTKPPEIVIGIPNYPSIPADIIRDVNNFL
jgi:hypothetical protein